MGAVAVSLIDSTQLASLQTRMLDALIDTCTVTRVTAPVQSVRGGRLSGGTTQTYSGPCLVETAAPAQITTLAGALVATNVHRIKFPVGTDIAAGDIIAVGARSFTVQGVASGSFGLLQFVSALEVGGA